MKVVLLESGRGNRAPVIDGWREKIGLAPEDSITLLSWYPPREPLPVDLQVVFGPRMRLRTKARSGAVLLDEIRRIREAEEKKRREEGLDLQQAYDADDDDDGMQDEDDLADQLPESMLGAAGTSSGKRAPAPHDTSLLSAQAAPDASESEDASAAIEEIIEAAADESPDAEAAQDAASAGAAVGTPTAPVSPPATPAPATPPAKPANDVLGLPKHHPERVKAAVRWRARKAVHMTKRSYPVRKGRVAVRRAIGGIPSEFALAMAGWKSASVAIGNADLVLSLDSRSQKAAWVLAQRVQGPPVVVSYPAAVRLIAQRRAEEADQQSA